MARDLFHPFIIPPGGAHEINAEFKAIACLQASATLLLEFGAGHKIPMQAGAEWLSETGPLSDRVRISHSESEAVSAELFVGLNRYVPPGAFPDSVAVSNFPDSVEVSNLDEINLQFPANLPPMVTPVGGNIRTVVVTGLVPGDENILQGAENVNGAIIRWLSIAALVSNLKSIDMFFGGQKVAINGGAPFTILNLLLPGGMGIRANSNLTGFNLSLQSEISIGFDLL